MCNKIKCNDQVLPSNISTTGNIVSHLCWDSFDLNEETPSGSGTAHSTHGIIIQERGNELQTFTNTPNMAEIKSEHQKRQEQKNTAAKKNAKKNLTTDEITIGTINMKEIVKQKKEKAVEDESDSDNLAFYSSSSSEITDIEEQIEKEREEEDLVIGMINYVFNCICALSLATCKRVQHPIANIQVKNVLSVDNEKTNLHLHLHLQF
ncbi:hypothetical protein RN001_009118 [Aquatica leii]|uniref:Uncharacterized protein n=1 Tax=Aquatica leii TaxID=1421715 RepID=A0AAN7P4S4_9COLE|nr:hypothetical protein RN001_009118 [Aquatica leii]